MTRPPAPPSLFFLIKLLMSIVDELQLVSKHQFVRPGPINTVSLQVLSEECSAVIGWWWLGSLVRDVSVTSAQINCDAWTHLYLINIYFYSGAPNASGWRHAHFYLTLSKESCCSGPGDRNLWTRQSWQRVRTQRHMTGFLCFYRIKCFVFC